MQGVLTTFHYNRTREGRGSQKYGLPSLFKNKADGCTDIELPIPDPGSAAIPLSIDSV